jgi:hypothetical protein
VADGDLIRAFPVSSLRESINKALATIPADKNIAVIAYANTNEVKLAAFARIGGDFSFMGVLEKPYGKTLQAEAALVWTK